jgi:hypothetical protein
MGLVRADVSDELSASITVTRIGEIGTTLNLTSNRLTLRRNTKHFFTAVRISNLTKFLYVMLNPY